MIESVRAMSISPDSDGWNRRQLAYYPKIGYGTRAARCSRGISTSFSNSNGNPVRKQTMPEQSEKKILTPEQAVRAACILFELNTGEHDLLEMAKRAGVPCDDDAERKALSREWYGFVHAAVVYGLMAQASNQVMAEYLRSTRTLLSQTAGYTPEQIEAFIDDTFSGYIRLMAQNQQKQCPALFYQRLVGENAIETLPKERVAFLSGMMAITICAILDKLGQYEFLVE